MLSDYREAAKALGVRPSTLRKWTSQKVIPFVRVGRCVRYDVSELIRHFRDKTNGESTNETRA
jgi:excisionase family DNA binding protein